MPRRQSINNKVINGDFTDAPSFTAATNTVQRWINGTAGGSTTDDSFKWGLFTLAGTVSAQFENGAMRLSTNATSSFIEVGPYRLDTNAARREKACPALPSTSYTGTFKMKTNLISGTATNGAQMAFAELNGDGTILVNNSSTPIRTTTDWTTYTVTFTTGVNTRFISPIMRIYGHQGTGTLIMSALFDDIKLDTTVPSVRVLAVDRV